MHEQLHFDFINYRTRARASIALVVGIYAPIMNPKFDNNKSPTETIKQKRIVFRLQSSVFSNPIAEWSCGYSQLPPWFWLWLNLWFIARIYRIVLSIVCAPHSMSKAIHLEWMSQAINDQMPECYAISYAILRTGTVSLSLTRSHHFDFHKNATIYDFSVLLGPVNTMIVISCPLTGREQRLCTSWVPFMSHLCVIKWNQSANKNEDEAIVVALASSRHRSQW